MFRGNLMLVAATTLSLAIVTAWWTSTQPPAEGRISVLACAAGLAGFLWFAVAGVVLAVIDVRHHRLPDAIVYPTVVAVTLLLSGSHLLDRSLSGALGVVGGAGALFAVYLVLVLVRPCGIGGGDVKLAPAVGAALGFFGWEAVVLGAGSGFALGAAWALVRIANARGGGNTVIPFGPFMLAGAWVGILMVSEVLALLRSS